MAKNPVIDRSKVTVYLNDKDLGTLRKMSEETGLGVSSIARMAIKGYLKAEAA